MISEVAKTRLCINSALLFFLFFLEWAWEVTCFSDTHTPVSIYISTHTHTC